MIVVDASVVANGLADNSERGSASRRAMSAGGQLAAPDLVDVETTSVLRRRLLAGHLDLGRCTTALAELRELRLLRYPALPLVERAVQLRDNLTAYDATYVALAEYLDCTLLTADARLAASPGPRCEMRLVGV